MGVWVGWFGVEKGPKSPTPPPPQPHPHPRVSKPKPVCNPLDKGSATIKPGRLWLSKSTCRCPLSCGVLTRSFPGASVNDALGNDGQCPSHDRRA